MKKIYAVTKVYEDGSKYFWDYFPTKEAVQKMYDGMMADSRVPIDLIVDELYLPVKCKDIDCDYDDKFETKDGIPIDIIVDFVSDTRKIFADVPVIDFWYDEREYWDIDHSYFVLDLTAEEAAAYVAAQKETRKHQYDEYLNSPFAKGWLRKMQYTERTDEYGHKFLFIAIKCGYNKISNKAFNKLCHAICMRTYGENLRMAMYIGGKVNWTMFYERPDHVDGHETYFCGVVGEDDFSPEDFDKDHSKYSFKNASRY